MMTNQKNTVMLHSTKSLTADQIRNLNLNAKDVMGYEFQWESGFNKYYITINGQRAVSFDNHFDRLKSFNKIKRMGFGLGWKAIQLTDEEQGIIQAGKNGENPFAYSIICGDPSRNEVVK